MARTKASVGAKVSSGKSSKARCSAAPPPSSTGSSGSNDRSSRSSSGAGNPVCPRETPKWQRPITNFFINKDTSNGEADGAGSSNSKPKQNTTESDEEVKLKPKKKRIIESDNEETEKEEPPKNKVLDETIELEPLSGEDSHKIEEFYPVNGKGKGVGKKTNKENVDSNIGRKSTKRDLDEVDVDNVSKKIKVN